MTKLRLDGNSELNIVKFSFIGLLILSDGLTNFNTQHFTVLCVEVRKFVLSVVLTSWQKKQTIAQFVKNCFVHGGL